MPKQISSAADLVTTPEATSSGFAEQAIERSDRAEGYIKRAQELRLQIAAVTKPEDLLKSPDLLTDIRSAAGFSAKAASKISGDTMQSIVARFLDHLYQQHPTTWRDELVSRYLITQGDSLGGTLRNLAGDKGKLRFAQAVRSALEQGSTEYKVQYRSNGEGVRSLAWSRRLLLFDRKPNIIAKNVDAILLDTQRADIVDDEKNTKILLESEKAYAACGEIKGGIDPAGADEHWKTALSALERIDRRFQLAPPALFFAGAAIANSMAQEIFSRLRSRRLAAAANLTKAEQVTALANWLVNI